MEKFTLKIGKHRKLQDWVSHLVKDKQRQTSEERGGAEDGEEGSALAAYSARHKSSKNAGKNRKAPNNDLRVIY